MKRIGDATLAEVLAIASAVGLTGDTLQKIRVNAPYSWWKFSGGDIGRVGAQLRTAIVQQPIEDIFETWCSQWGEADRGKHRALVAALGSDGDFRYPPIICGSAREMIDGANRSFAAFRAGRQDRTLEIRILWGRAPLPPTG
jgi:hypothetical protein